MHSDKCPPQSCSFLRYLSPPFDSHPLRHDFPKRLSLLKLLTKHRFSPSGCYKAVLQNAIDDACSKVE